MKSQIDNQNNDEIIDLRYLFVLILKNWYVFFACIFLSLLAGFFYLKVAKPEYLVDALLRVESGRPQADTLLADLSGFNVESPVQAEVEILKSRMILGKVAQQLNLDKLLKKEKSSFISSAKNEIFYSPDKVEYRKGSSHLSILLFETTKGFEDVSLRLTVKGDKYQVSVKNQGEYKVLGIAKPDQENIFNNESEHIKLNISFSGITNDDQFTLKKLGPKSAAGRISRNLAASEKGKRTGILEVKYQGDDKQLITDTLNRVLDVYIKENILRLSAQKKQTLGFLEEQLPKLKKDLNRVENKFNRFRKANNTVDVNKESQLLLEKSVKLETKRSELIQKKSALKSRFTDEYPLIEQINEQLKSLAKEQKGIEKRLTNLPDIQKSYFQLYRDVEVKSQLYTNLLNSYQQLKIANAGEVGNVRLIDKAVKPLSPIKPKKKLIMVLFLLLGTALASIIVLLKNLFNSGIKDSRVIENQTGLPILANIPRSTTQKGFFKNLNRKKHLHNLLFKVDSQDMAIEALRSLRTSLYFSLKSAKNNIIMVTGASPNIGKSFVSSNFAAVLASTGKRVVLIDGDLRRGHIHKYYGVNNDTGLSGYLLKQVDSISIRDTIVQNMSLISRGKNPDNPSEVLMSDRFTQLLETLSEENDYVIIDSPPTLAVADSAIIGSLAGTTLVLARYGISKLEEIQLTVDRLNTAGCNVTGLIFNDVQREAGNTYGYQYGYNYKSK